MKYIIRGMELRITISGAVHFYPNTQTGFLRMVRDLRRSK